MAAGPTLGRRPWRRFARYAGAVAIGVVIGLSSVIIANGGPLLAPPSGSIGYIFFYGVQIDIFYEGGMPHSFGPNEQQSCLNCPLNLSGGTTITLQNILRLAFPPDTTTTYFFNVTSPIPFEEWQCFWSGTSRPAGWPPYGCPFTTSLESDQPSMDINDLNSTVTMIYPLTLAVPNPAPDLPGGFEVQIAITAWESPNQGQPGPVGGGNT